MAVGDIYALPSSIRSEIHELMEYEELNEKYILKMILDRYEGSLVIKLDDLKEYIKVMKERAKNNLMLPVPVASVGSFTSNALGRDKGNDNSPLADYHNSRQVMDMFMKDLVSSFTNLKRVKDDAYKRDEILTNLEAIALNYMRVGGDLMEKEGKLKLDMQESNKNLEYIRNQIRIMLQIIKSVLKKSLNEHKYREVSQAISEVLGLYKFKE